MFDDIEDIDVSTFPPTYKDTNEDVDGEDLISVAELQLMYAYQTISPDGDPPNNDMVNEFIEGKDLSDDKAFEYIKKVYC
jgi:hypothetical protein